MLNPRASALDREEAMAFRLSTMRHELRRLLDEAGQGL
jgi:hypothetical protein